MNILIERLPTNVIVGSLKYKIDSDFATILQIIDIFERLDTDKAVLTALILFYGDNIPEDKAEACKVLIDFISPNKNNDDDEPNTINFNQDADLIFSAFYQSYGIDLTEINMHWYKFLALLQGLPNNTTLSYVQNIRNMDLSQITDKKQKNKLAKAKKQLSIKSHKQNNQENVIEEYYKKMKGE